MVSEYVKDLYDSRIEEGDFCVVYEQEQWDGYGNNLELLNYMKKRGWKLVDSHIYVNERGDGSCIAENTTAELLFEAIPGEY